MSEQRAVVDWRAILFDNAPIGICVIMLVRGPLMQCQQPSFL